MPRYIKKNTTEDLRKFLADFIQKNEEIADSIESALVSLEECIGTSKLMKDLSKFDFYYENVLLEEHTKKTAEDVRSYFYDDFSLMGFQTVEDRTFYGVLAGSDYGLPLYFILYQDDKNTLRGYIPSKGNVLNPHSKMPFGEDEDMDEKFAKEHGFSTVWEMDEKGFAFLNKEQLIEDICKRLYVK
ncbi:MAG: hypothetical protein H9W83_08680 [Leuconostoc sp.]|nr:hypothetical protein [Leuconostoc sp.]